MCAHMVPTLLNSNARYELQQYTKEQLIKEAILRGTFKKS